MVQPFILHKRRELKEGARLPERTGHVLSIAFDEGREETMYMADLLGKVNKGAACAPGASDPVKTNRFQVLRILMPRQICCDPRLFLCMKIILCSLPV